MRGGTENVAAVVGFGDVCRAGLTSPTSPTQIFIDEVRRLIPTAVFTADGAPCLHTHVHLRIPGVSAEVALINLDRLGVAASSGAACSSGSVEPSHVLLAAGLSEQEAAEGLRFTFGRDNTERQARSAAERLAEAVSAAQAR